MSERSTFWQLNLTMPPDIAHGACEACLRAAEAAAPALEHVTAKDAMLQAHLLRSGWSAWRNSLKTKVRFILLSRSGPQTSGSRKQPPRLTAARQHMCGLTIWIYSLCFTIGRKQQRPQHQMTAGTALLSALAAAVLPTERIRPSSPPAARSFLPSWRL